VTGQYHQYRGSNRVIYAVGKGGRIENKEKIEGVAAVAMCEDKIRRRECSDFLLNSVGVHEINEVRHDNGNCHARLLK
jgi:hypothetical protein